MKYLKTHFLKYIQKGLLDNHDPVLLIYDGHASYLFYPLMPHMLFNPLMLVVLHLSKLAITASVT